MLQRFTIYGERCSGTNFLQESIETNFDAEVTWAYGWKHFFGFADLSQSDDVLFIGIVRDAYEWINSLRRNPWHLSKEMLTDNDAFLNKEVRSFHFNGAPIVAERHFSEERPFKNLYELRYEKCVYLHDVMPHKVRHYLFLRYEDLLQSFDECMAMVSRYLQRKQGHTLIKPLWYKTNRRRRFRPSEIYLISRQEFVSNPHYACFKDQEEIMGYTI